jgi:hypothetical protein
MRTDVDDWEHFAGLRYKHEGGGRFLFASRTSVGDTHVLDVHDGTCSCPGFQIHKKLCCHFLAVRVLIRRLKQEAIH